MIDEPVNWEQEGYGWRLSYPESKTCNVDDVHLAQPIGFVWLSKPRYRVKAKSRKL